MTDPDWRAVALEQWPDPAWICGDGPWAVVLMCSRALQLEPTIDLACRVATLIDERDGGCGPECLGPGHHPVHHLELPPAEMEA